MRTLSALSGKNAGRLLASTLLAMSLSAVTHAATSIYGTPTTSIAENRYYGFQSWATDTDHRAVKYSITNKPSWATFNTEYGHLYGVPTAANVGTYKDIVISASDGISHASLPAFSITVTGTGSSSSSGGSSTTSGSSTSSSGGSTSSSGGSTSSSGGATTTTGSATLSWQPPTENTNGTALTNLAGYTISYGTNSQSLSTTVKLANAGLTSYVVEDLAAGTYYFAISAYNSSGVASQLSSIVSKAIR